MRETQSVAFRTQAELRAWFEKHHDREKELVMRLFRTSAADRGVTYAQALDEALCFGWIDGVRRSYDDISYIQRFTPRKARSVWSNVNIRHAERLIREGRMTKAGLAVFERRDPARSGIYSFEQRPAEFPDAYRARFMKKKRAWAFFETLPPGYRRTTIHFVMSAKREETRLKRLQVVIDCSARGERIPLLPQGKPRPRG